MTKSLAHFACIALTLCAAPCLNADEGVTQYPLPEVGGPGEDMQRLKGDSLWDAISGTTLLGIYRGRRRSSGTQHFTEHHDPNGTTDYREGDLSGQGRWAIIRDQLCFAYKDILSPGPHCFVIIQSGNCLFNYREKLIKNNLPTHTELWSSKAVPKGQISTCDIPIG